MYDNTLIIFVSDNGGPIYEPGGASNHPLRGGKETLFEGGFRTNAFVSGGFVRESRRGTKFEGVISIADWYGTLAELAGGDIEDQQPPVVSGGQRAAVAKHPPQPQRQS